MTTLFFTNRRDRQRLDERGALERICGERWDGDDLPIEERLVLDADIAFQLVLTCWDVLEDDAHVYDAWLFAGDSGVVAAALADSAARAKAI